ncbi:MAG TPA: HU family DNA-binding protein [Calditrichia bacterium]|nr:integration host factor subunit beta [Calditrichota bacterium]HQU71038.1 HU family DNA-binding protein [Calditrichia bacterium]HQV31746.1 HU family DNA-binding protein [Calditrichia bacterium]
MTVTKADLVNLLSDSTGMSKAEVDEVVNGFLYRIIESLERGDRVEIRGFGSFFARERDNRLVKNPRTKEIVSVDRRFVPVFRPAKHFRETVNQQRLKESSGDS